MAFLRLASAPRLTSAATRRLALCSALLVFLPVSAAANDAGVADTQAADTETANCLARCQSPADAGTQRDAAAHDSAVDGPDAAGQWSDSRDAGPSNVTRPQPSTPLKDASARMPTAPPSRPRRYRPDPAPPVGGGTTVVWEDEGGGCGGAEPEEEPIYDDSGCEADTVDDESAQGCEPDDSDGGGCEGDDTADGCEDDGCEGDALASSSSSGRPTWRRLSRTSTLPWVLALLLLRQRRRRQRTAIRS